MSHRTPRFRRLRYRLKRAIRFLAEVIEGIDP